MFRAQDTENGGLIPTSAMVSSSDSQPADSPEESVPTPTAAPPVLKEVQGKMDADAKKQKAVRAQVNTLESSTV